MTIFSGWLLGALLGLCLGFLIGVWAHQQLRPVNKGQYRMNND